MIPKVIHLCWVSGKRYPSKIRFCIKSWKKYNPDYKIMLWNADSFDFDSVPWTKEALKAQKYAFIADFIRLYAVYNYGGIYLDSDVEVVKSFDSLLDKPYFVSFETGDSCIELGAFGAEKGTRWVKDALDYYRDRHFFREDGSIDDEVQPKVIWEHLKDRYELLKVDSPQGIANDTGKVFVLPNEWLCAHRYGTVYNVTGNTFCIHHFANSWRAGEKYTGGMLHRLYYMITCKDWHLDDKHVRLYGKNRNR